MASSVIPLHAWDERAVGSYTLKSFALFAFFAVQLLFLELGVRDDLDLDRSIDVRVHVDGELVLAGIT